MSTIKDGGQAFPSRRATGTRWTQEKGHETIFTDTGGMSLRDWFAGQALAGFMANTNRPTTYHPDDATWAYTIADAMLKASEVQS